MWQGVRVVHKWYIGVGKFHYCLVEDSYLYGVDYGGSG